MTLTETIAKARASHPEMILLFRQGDYYFAYGQDAYDLAAMLGLTVTSFDKMPASGFNDYLLEKYLKTILVAGRRVAIMDKKEVQS